MATLQEVVDQLKKNNNMSGGILKEVSSLNGTLSSFFTREKQQSSIASKKSLEAVREASKSGPAAASVAGKDGARGPGGFLGGFKGGLLGSLLAGGGIGLAAVGVGLAGFFGALSGVDSIMNKFGDGSNLKKLMTNLAGGLAAFSDRDLKALGAVLGAGALFGAVPLLSGLGGGVGVGAMGVGIAAFFTALAGGDMAIGMMESTGKNLSQFLQNFAQGIGSLDDKSLLAVGGLLATSGAFGALFGVGKSAKAGVSIALIGAGIAAFFAAFAAGDMAISAMEANGESIKKIIMVFGEMVDGLSGKTLTALTAIAGVATLAALFPGGTKVAAKAAGGLAAIGTGIGLFFAGIGLGDAAISKVNDLFGTKPGEGFGSLLKNTAEGLKAFTDLKFDPNLGENLEGISSALLAFFGTKFINTITDVLAPVKDAFLGTLDAIFGTSYKEESNKSPFQRLLDGLAPAKTLDPKLLTNLDLLSNALIKLSSSFSNLEGIDVKTFGAGIESTVRGLSFASVAMKGLQTGVGNDGDQLDTRPFYGGGFTQAGGRYIELPPGGIDNALQEVDIDRLRNSISKVYNAFGVNMLENVRRDANMSTPTTGGGGGGNQSFVDASDKSVTSVAPTYSFGNRSTNPNIQALLNS